LPSGTVVDQLYDDYNCDDYDEWENGLNLVNK